MGRAAAAASSAAWATPSFDASRTRAVSASSARRGVGPAAPMAMRQDEPASVSRQLTATLTTEISPILVRPSLLYEPADLPAWRRQVDAGQELALLHGRAARPGEELADGDAPRTACAIDLEHRVQAQQRGRGVGGGAGVAAVAADCGPVAELVGCDRVGALGEHVIALANERVRAHLVHRACRADHQPAVRAQPDVAHARQALQVDHPRRA